MNTIVSNRINTLDKLSRLSVVIWACMLVLFGTYIRSRPGDMIPETDWLIIAQISISIFGGILGILLMLRQCMNIRLGAKVLFAYLVTTAFSAVFSPYSKIVIGYWFLLFGTSLLTLGIVQRAKTLKDLERIEKIWLITISLSLLKDTFIALFFPELIEIQVNDEPFRLGIGLTHANEMSILASVAFWISFKKDKLKYPIILWVFRLFFILIIMLSRSRVSLTCLLIGGVIWFWFQDTSQSKQGLKRIVIFCTLFSIIITGILISSIELPGVNSLLNYLNRGQDVNTIMSLTGRTEIWSFAINKIFNGPISFLGGHGYGVTKLVLNDEGILPFYAYHCHNAFLETFFGVGLLGFIPFVVLLFYSTSWLHNFKKLSRVYSSEFALHAVTIVSIVLTNSITESYISMKVNPIIVIYLFYILALDRKQSLNNLS